MNMYYHHFIIIEKGGTKMVRAGRGTLFTYNRAYAKKFTSEWSANNFLGKMNDSELYQLKKIAHQ